MDCLDEQAKNLDSMSKSTEIQTKSPKSWLPTWASRWHSWHLGSPGAERSLAQCAALSCTGCSPWLFFLSRRQWRPCICQALWWWPLGISCGWVRTGLSGGHADNTINMHDYPIKFVSNTLTFKQGNRYGQRKGKPTILVDTPILVTVAPQFPPPPHQTKHTYIEKGKAFQHSCSCDS